MMTVDDMIGLGRELDDLQRELREARSKRLQLREYVVSGNGDFPLDMLRYDTSIMLEGHVSDESTELRQVRLQYRGLIQNWTPTEQRWRSFGWNVTSIRHQ